VIVASIPFFAAVVAAFLLLAIEAW
jgi:hypothetical protein